MKTLVKSLTITLLSLSFIMSGQSVGSWTSHLPYKNGQKVTEAGNKIFCVSQNGLFYFDKDDNSTNKFTKDDGLSSISITSINYHESTNQIILGYADGNIDLLNSNLEVTNLTDISRTSSVIGSKAITNISFFKDLAYLATNFGVVVLDMKNLEVKETYRNIGPNGEEGIIKNVIIDDVNNQLYTHNEFGICKAPIEGLNLLNFENWEYLKDSTGQLQNTFDFYAFFNKKLYAGKSTVGIFTFSELDNEFSITNASIVSWSNMFSLSVRNNHLVSSYLFNSYTYDKDGISVNYGDSEFQNKKNDALIDKQGFVWSAEENVGLVSNYFGETSVFSPSGVTSSSAFSIYTHDKNVLVGAGGYNGVYVPNNSGDGFYFYSNFKWKNYNTPLVPSYTHRDIVDAVYDPLRDKYFLASYISGLIVWDGDKDFVQLTPADSAGIPFFTILGQTRITSVNLDNNSNIWVTNHLTQGAPSIHKLKPDNSWQSYSLKESNATEPLDLLIDDTDQKWIITGKGRSIVVWNDKTNDERTLSNSNGNGALPSSKINCITKDKTGQIWVGTDAGIAIFTDPENALSESFYEATLPIFEQRPLLQDEQVLAIAVDGANRKWFGTSNGVFLFDENATENIQTFNTSNSLLPSNNIQDIGINKSTGEVFFATNEGIVSFWGDATEPETDFGSAKIFPNPINPDFDGYVTINGLKENSAVKITDMAGKLVYEQTSNGGTATWNTKTISGKLVNTGVYLVYSSDPEFEEKFIGKIVIVH